jgi:lipoprotein-anchoring transpeptidase ErfK/SrfK
MLRKVEPSISVLAKGVLASVLALAPLEPCMAQSWLPWGGNFFGTPPGYYPPSGHRERMHRRAEQKESETKVRPADTVKAGGPQPEIAPKAPSVVAFPHSFPVRSIVIDTSRRKLYFIVEQGRAYEYPIAVGRTGFRWTGIEPISRKQAWPDWHPPPEMRARDSSLPKKMTGGVRNPLGAIALYLGDTQYRIHGTNDAKSIGSAQSSGCFRMVNSAALHLASLADIGTTVTVVDALPKIQASVRAGTGAGQRDRETVGSPDASGSAW